MVMLTGLVGFILLIAGAALQALPALDDKTGETMRRAVLAPDYDASLCPRNWKAAHAENAGLTEAEMETWYRQGRRSLDDATLLEVLRAHRSAPTDFRYRAPLALAKLQIVMCLATERGLDLP
jgi:hypothetical protein